MIKVQPDQNVVLDIVEAQRDQLIQDAWAAMLETEEGRLILWSILDRAGVNQFPYFGDRRDDEFRGRQRVGSEILDSHVFPLGMSYYTDMLLEAEALHNNLRVEVEASYTTQEE